MTSCEPARCSAYSDDVRWRIVWQTVALRLPTKQVATNLCIDQSTVCRIRNKFEATGQVQKKVYPAEKVHRKLTQSAQFFLVLERPGIYLREIRSELLSQLGLITNSAICKFLHKAGFTRQRLQTCASQRDEALRAQFSSDVSLYSRDMFIFLDETGTDRRDTFRAKGYSLRGKPAISQKLLVRGELSALCLLSTEGILACKVARGSVNGDTYRICGEFSNAQSHAIWWIRS